MDNHDFWGHRLREIREKRGITQQQIAQATDEDVTQISRYERGGGAKKMPKTFKRDLLGLFTEPEIEYIAMGKRTEPHASGKNVIGSIGSVSGGNVQAGDMWAGPSAGGQRPQAYDKSVQAVVDLLLKMNDAQRMKVFMHAAQVFAGKE